MANHGSSKSGSSAHQSAKYESSDGLVVALVDGVLRITLDRPKKRNALDDSMITALNAHLERVNTDESVRAIWITSNGDDFCSGFDLLARNAPGDGDEPPARPRAGSVQRRLPGQAHRLIPLMLSTQVPIVCSTRGWVAGIGLHLAVAADFCVTARDARFWEPFTTRGFTPDSGGTWLIPRLIGVARAKDLLLLGRELSGEEAAEWGLVHQAVDGADVDTTSSALVDRLAAGPTVALGLTKWLVHQGAGLDLEHHLASEALALEVSARSDDFKEGIAALREKRDPNFQGR
jgi:2-(1,2-epoxy-1,2-dihydrophenyl)acetyl-CoA isomerase